MLSERSLACGAALALAGLALLSFQLSAPAQTTGRALTFQDFGLTDAQVQMRAYACGEVIAGPGHVTHSIGNAGGPLVHNRTGFQKEVEVTAHNYGDASIEIRAKASNESMFLSPGETRSMYFLLGTNQDELEYVGQGNGTHMDFVYVVRRIAIQ